MAGTLRVGADAGVQHVRRAEGVDHRSERSTNEALGVGLGPLQHRPKSGGRPWRTRLTHGVLTAVTAAMLAASPALAQTPGAPLSPEPSSATELAAPRAESPSSTWQKIPLAEDQAIVSRYWQDGDIGARVELRVPWPESAPQSIASAELWAFAEGDRVDARVEDGVLHLTYDTHQGLQATLQGKGVFHLEDEGGNLHFLSVEAPRFTLDNTQIYRQEVERYLGNLAEQLELHERSGSSEAVLEQTKASIAEAEANLAKFDGGAVFRSVVDTDAR